MYFLYVIQCPAFKIDIILLNLSSLKIYSVLNTGACKIIISSQFLKPVVFFLKYCANFIRDLLSVMKSCILFLFQLNISNKSLKEYFRFVAAILQSCLHNCKSLVKMVRRDNPNTLWFCLCLNGLKWKLKQYLPLCVQDTGYIDFVVCSLYVLITNIFFILGEKLIITWLLWQYDYSGDIYATPPAYLIRIKEEISVQRKQGRKEWKCIDCLLTQGYFLFE